MNKKVKKFLSDMGTSLILGALLIIFLILAAIVSKYTDKGYDEQAIESQIAIIEGIIADSDAEEKGLNRALVIWDYDIALLRDDFTEQFPEYVEYVNADVWHDSFNVLLDNISSFYISDEDIYQRIKEIIPGDLFHLVLENYLKSMALIRGDLIK